VSVQVSQILVAPVASSDYGSGELEEPMIDSDVSSVPGKISGDFIATNDISEQEVWQLDEPAKVPKGENESEPYAESENQIEGFPAPPNENETKEFEFTLKDKNQVAYEDSGTINPDELAPPVVEKESERNKDQAKENRTTQSTNQSNLNTIHQPTLQSDQNHKGLNSDRDKQILAHWSGSLTSDIQGAIPYPRLAEKKQHQGNLEVLVHFDSFGQFKSIEVVSGTGFNTLDKPSVKWLKKRFRKFQHPDLSGKKVPIRISFTLRAS